jgi:hypothetical protein
MEPQKKKMGLGKKILIGFGILILLGVIRAATKDEKNSASAGSSISASNSSSSSSSDAEYKKVGDQIEVGDFSYVVNKAMYKKTVGGEYSSKTADGIFLIVNVTFRNNDKEEHTLDNSFFKLTDAAGTEFSSSTEGETALEMSDNATLFMKQCPPHIAKTGYLIFEVPKKDVYDIHLSGGLWSGKTAVVKLTQ